MSTTTIDALIAAVDADPDDDERFLVLADALLSAGDPRGELVGLQHRRARPRRPCRAGRGGGTVSRRVGPLLRWCRVFWDPKWRLGFLDELKIDGGVHDREHGSDVSELLAALVRAPVSRWLRKLWVRLPDRRALDDTMSLVTLGNLRTKRERARHT